MRGPGFNSRLGPVNLLKTNFYQPGEGYGYFTQSDSPIITFVTGIKSQKSRRVAESFIVCTGVASNDFLLVWLRAAGFSFS